MCFNLTINFIVEDCIYCGFYFGLPKGFILRRKQDHKIFFCPSCGKEMHWPQLSEKEKLKKQLENVQECCIKYEKKSEELYRSNRALRGHITRIKKSIKTEIGARGENG